MSRLRHRKGRPYRTARQQMFEMYGTLCWICGHGGATDADHLVPISVDSEQPVDPHGMRPAHGVNGCPTCGRKCNQERGTRAVASMYRPALDW
jgi:hypothetical protein